jgi:hypothetical protein
MAVSSSGWFTRRIGINLPSAVLSTNMAGDQVFRSDRVLPAVPPLKPDDSKIASDHLPVMVVLRNPYLGPFAISGFSLSHQTATIRWRTVLGARYRVEGSANPASWIPVATNLLGTGGQLVQQTTATGPLKFYRVPTEQ